MPTDSTHVLIAHVPVSYAGADYAGAESALAFRRKAALFDPAKASASTWIATIARNLRIEKLAD